MTFDERSDTGAITNPSSQPALVEMWRSAINKARTEIPPPPVLPAVIAIHFDGAGQVLTVGMAGLVEVTFPCTILSCRIYAGAPTLEPVTVTATIDLRRGQQGAWSAGGHTLYGSTIPTITAQAEANVSIAGWETALQPGDLIAWNLLTFTGSATWMALTLPVRRLDTRGVGESGITDSFSTGITDSFGNPVVLRS